MNSVAHPLRLDYMQFEEATGREFPSPRCEATKPAFIELIAPQEECMIDFEALSDNKMHVQWKVDAARLGK
jgi:hypothetical protein